MGGGLGPKTLRTKNGVTRFPFCKFHFHDNHFGRGRRGIPPLPQTVFGHSKNSWRAGDMEEMDAGVCEPVSPTGQKFQSRIHAIVAMDGRAMEGCGPKDQKWAQKAAVPTRTSPRTVCHSAHISGGLNSSVVRRRANGPLNTAKSSGHPFVGLGLQGPPLIRRSNSSTPSPLLAFTALPAMCPPPPPASPRVRTHVTDTNKAQLECMTHTHTHTQTHTLRGGDPEHNPLRVADVH